MHNTLTNINLAPFVIPAKAGISLILFLFCSLSGTSQTFQGKIKYLYYSDGFSQGAENHNEESQWLVSFGKDKFKQHIISGNSALKDFIQVADVTKNKIHRYHLNGSAEDLKIKDLASCRDEKKYHNGAFTITPLTSNGEKTILGHPCKRYKIVGKVVTASETKEITFYCWATKNLAASEILKRNALCITYSDPVLFPEIDGIILELLYIDETKKLAHLWKALEIKPEILPDHEFDIPMGIPN